MAGEGAKTLKAHSAADVSGHLQCMLLLMCLCMFTLHRLTGRRKTHRPNSSARALDPSGRPGHAADCQHPIPNSPVDVDDLERRHKIQCSQRPRAMLEMDLLPVRVGERRQDVPILVHAGAQREPVDVTVRQNHGKTLPIGAGLRAHNDVVERC